GTTSSPQRRIASMPASAPPPASQACTRPIRPVGLVRRSAWSVGMRPIQYISCPRSQPPTLRAVSATANGRLLRKSGTPSPSIACSLGQRGATPGNPRSCYRNIGVAEVAPVTQREGRAARAGSLLGGALRAGAEQLDGVLHVAEPVLGAHPRGPVLHSGRIQLHGGSALPADPVVMVVPGEALAVQRLAVGRAQHVHLAAVGEHLHGPVHGGQADLLTPVPEHLVQLLGAAEVIGPVQQLSDGGPLAGHALHWPTSCSERLTSSGRSGCGSAC